LTRIAILFITILSVVPAWADSDQYQGSMLIDRYQEALARQRDAFRDVSMEVHMEGRIPKLKKEGKLSALRAISSLGKVTYKAVSFWGDDTVKKEVMARYMTAEVEAASQVQAEPKENIAITPENYQFKYKGLNDRGGSRVHVFELKPRHKRIGLFKGELWLDPDTCLPVHEAGRLVKNPSVFIKKMEFARYYEIKDGVAYLRRMETKTDTRIIGRAELNIEYANFHKPADVITNTPVAVLRAK
jgi:hypothetical protein